MSYQGNLGGFTTPTPVAAGSRAFPNWGSTFLADLFNNERFQQAVYEQIYYNFRFASSGLVTLDSRLNATEGGVSTTLPIVLPFNAKEEVIESNATWGDSGAGYLTPQKVNAKLQQYPIMHRGFLVAADDLSRLGSGVDPLGAASQYLGTNLASHKTDTLLSVMDGLFGTAGVLLPNLTDVTRTGAGTSDEANFLSAAAVTRAKQKLGERKSGLRYIAMHSDVHSYLDVIGMLTFSTDSLSTGGNIAWGGGGVGVTATDVQTFAGLRVIVDDKLEPTIDATNGDKYPCYIYGQGAIMEGIQQPLRVETGRNLASKQDEMSPDIHYSMGIPGLTYAGTFGSPDNTDLATPANWEMVYDQGAKMVPICKLLVNTPYAINP